MDPRRDQRTAVDSVTAPGAELLRAVAVMDRLRSPGGCPWDAAQTHASLVRYLVEECYEVVQAIEDNDPAALREELGDLLLQVLFHARIAQESADPAQAFSVDDVASSLVAKLIRRHPHVFEIEAADATTDSAVVGAHAAPDSVAPRTAEDQQQRWDELKQRENGRAHPLAGVAMSAPSVALAGKLGSRSARYGLEVTLPTGESVPEQIFRLAFTLGASGADPESEVAAVARAYARGMAAAAEGNESAS